MNTSRRVFLKSSIYAIAAASSTFGFDRWTYAEPDKSIRVRKSVTTLNAASPDIVALTAGIKAMKHQLAADDPRNWLAQSKIHGDLAGTFNLCQHGNWFFTPWHRAYLYCFEQIIRKLSDYPDFALPYWDWSVDQKLPALFWDKNDLNDIGGEIPSSVGRGADMNKDTVITKDDAIRFVNPSAVNPILNSDFITFGGASPDDPNGASGALEGTPHNFIHRWVSGDMVTAGSAFDPIFWLHHCNVDRLFSVWMAKHPNGLPTDPAWQNKQFDGLVDGDKNPFQLKVSDMIKSTDIFYRYDKEIEPSAPMSRTELKPNFAATAKIATVDQLAIGSIKPDAAMSEALGKISTNLNQRGTTLRVILTGIKIPADLDVVIDVYVNCLKLTPETPISDSSYIGSVTFFHGPHAANHVAHGSNLAAFTLIANGAFAKLYGDRPLKKDEPIQIGVITRPFSSKSGSTKIDQIAPENVRFEIVEE